MPENDQPLDELVVHPKEIKGSWDEGYVLDLHTISSTFIGYNEFGHPEFDTQRSPLGELIYRLKYKGDKSTIAVIVQTVVTFLRGRAMQPEIVVPMPPSKAQRAYQPVVEIASALRDAIGIGLNIECLSKATATAQMKDIGDFAERVKVLETALAADRQLEGKRVLLIDDLLQSGASMNVAARKLKEQGNVRTVYAIALTRTRG